MGKIRQWFNELVDDIVIVFSEEFKHIGGGNG